MPQEQFALKCLADGFGNAALGKAEPSLNAPQIKSGRHLEASGFRGNEYFANNPKKKLDIMELVDDPAPKFLEEDAYGPPAPLMVKSEMEAAAADGDHPACLLPHPKVSGTPRAAEHAKA